MARAWLADRSVLALCGADRTGFLQGLVSNDIAAATASDLVWTGFLTPQGRYLSDFFVHSMPECLLLDVPKNHAEFLRTRLSRFRLRADIRIEHAPYRVEAGWDEAMPDDARPDPRLPAMGWRRLAPQDTAAGQSDGAHYTSHRLAHGVTGSEDCEQDKTLLLEANFDWLNGISWSKGCYMGQELTARTHYRGLVRKRLVPVHGSSILPPSGTPLMAEGREIGQMRSSTGKAGLAFLRREYWTTEIACDGVTLTPQQPDWFRTETP